MSCLLNLILILSFISRAYLSDIIAQGITDVEFGQNALLSCTLPFASGVKHVTWQRVREHENVHTLATFSEQFQDSVDKQYVGKVTFLLASFNSTSIEIKNITFEDEACYICSFKVYPSGPKRKTFCLTVKVNNTTPRSYIITFSVIIVMTIVVTVIFVICRRTWLQMTVLRGTPFMT